MTAQPFYEILKVGIEEFLCVCVWVQVGRFRFIVALCWRPFGLSLSAFLRGASCQTAACLASWADRARVLGNDRKGSGVCRCCFVAVERLSLRAHEAGCPTAYTFAPWPPWPLALGPRDVSACHDSPPVASSPSPGIR